MNIEKPSRRNFMKKTTVLAVGVSSITLFTGLVRADEVYHEKCQLVTFRTKCKQDTSIYQEGLVCDVQCGVGHVMWQAWCRTDLTASPVELGKSVQIAEPGNLECQIIKQNPAS